MLCILPTMGSSSQTVGTLPTPTTNTFALYSLSERMASTNEADPGSFVCFPTVINTTIFGPLRVVFLNTSAASFRASSILLPF